MRILAGRNTKILSDNIIDNTKNIEEIKEAMNKLVMKLFKNLEILVIK